MESLTWYPRGWPLSSPASPGARPEGCGKTFSPILRSSVSRDTRSQALTSSRSFISCSRMVALFFSWSFSSSVMLCVWASLRDCKEATFRERSSAWRCALVRSVCSVVLRASMSDRAFVASACVFGWGRGKQEGRQKSTHKGTAGKSKEATSDTSGTLTTPHNK